MDGYGLMDTGNPTKEKRIIRDEMNLLDQVLSNLIVRENLANQVLTVLTSEQAQEQEEHTITIQVAVWRDCRSAHSLVLEVWRR